MENRIQRLFLRALFVAQMMLAVQATAVLAADGKDNSNSSDQVIKPDVDRREIERPKIDSQDFEAGVYYGILSIKDFGTNSVKGVTLTYHVTEDNFIEAEYGTSKGDKSSFEELSGGAQILDSNDRDYKYYSLDIGGDIFPGEIFVGTKYAFASSFYVVAGLGGTEFAGDNFFTVNVGVGYRVLFNDWFALHFDARDYIYDSDIFGKDQRNNNLELRTGFTVFF